MAKESLAKAAAVKYAQQYIDELAESVHLGYITDPAEVGGYPVYAGTPYTDTDHDGLPDAWERQHQLNSANAADATQDTDGDGYTNIEEFINFTNPRAS